MKGWKSFVPLMLFLLFILQLDVDFHLHDRLIKSFRKYNRKAQLVKSPYSIQRRLSIRHPVTQKKPVVVVIASYNNEAFCAKNIRSVLSQTYDNYRVIYIDDCSQDHTFDVVKKIVEESNQKERFTLIKNSKRRRKMPNLYEAFHSCSDDEIIVTLDGDDWFAHDKVLEEYNTVYQNPDVWLTYGSAIFYPEYEKVLGEPLTNNQLLKQKVRDLDRFDICMPRTFYAGLFKQIKLKDFFYQEKYIEMSDDPAFMFPMIEMAGPHVKFCGEVHYIINNINPISDHHTSENFQTTLRRYFQWEKEKYPMKDEWFTPTKVSTDAMTQSIDVAILSHNSPLELSATLASYNNRIRGVRDLYVIYKADSSDYEEAYKTLQREFPSVTFLSSHNQAGIQKVFHAPEKGQSPYIAVSQDNFVFKQPIDLSLCTTALETTKGVSFVLAHMDKMCTKILVNNLYSAMQLRSMLKNAKLANAEMFSILQKEPLAKHLSTDTGRLFEVISDYHMRLKDKEEIALIFNQESFLTLHSPEVEKNIDRETLFQKFTNGGRVDLVNYCKQDVNELNDRFIVESSLKGQRRHAM